MGYALSGRRTRLLYVWLAFVCAVAGVIGLSERAFAQAGTAADAVVNVFGGPTDGNMYLQPGDDARLFAAFRVAPAQGKSIADEDTFTVRATVGNPNPGIYVKADNANLKVKRAEVSSWVGEDLPSRLQAAYQAATDADAGRYESLQTSGSSNEGRQVSVTLKDVKKNEVFFVEFDVHVEETVANGSNLWFQIHGQIEGNEKSQRNIAGFWVGRPRWQSETWTTSASTQEAHSDFEPNDAFDVHVKATQVQANVGARDATLEVVLPKGVSLKGGDESLPKATFTSKATPTSLPTTHQADAVKSAEADGAVKLTWKVESAGSSTIAALSENSTVEVTIPCVVDSAALVGPQTIQAHAFSSLANTGEGNSSHVIRIDRPRLSGAVSNPSQAVAQIGDHLKWTISVTETSRVVDAKGAYIAIDWGTALNPVTAGSEVASSGHPVKYTVGDQGLIRAGETVTFEVEAVVIRTAQSGEAATPKVSVGAQNASEAVLDKDVAAVNIASPKVALIREFHPTSGVAGATVTVHVHVTNEVVGTHADSVFVDDNLPEGFRPTGTPRVYEARDDQLTHEAPADEAKSCVLTDNGASVTLSRVSSEDAYVLVYEAVVKTDASVGSTHTGTASSEFHYSDQTIKAEATSQFSVSSAQLSLTQAHECLSQETPEQYRSDGYVQAGERVKWSGILTSVGTEAPKNVVISGTVPSGVKIESVKVGAVSPQLNGQSWSYELGGSLGTSGSTTWEVIGTIEAGHAGSVLDNQVKATADAIPETVMNSPVTVVAPALSITRRATNGSDVDIAHAQPGDVVIYVTDVVQTQDHAYATDLELEDVLPDGLDAVLGSGKVLSGSAKVHVEPGNREVMLVDEVLSFQDDIKYSYEAKVRDDCPQGLLRNTGTATADFLSSVTVESDIDVAWPVAEASWGDADVDAVLRRGEKKTYTLTVKNVTANTRLVSPSVEIDVREGLSIDAEGVHASVGTPLVEGNRIRVSGISEIRHGVPLTVSVPVTANMDAEGSGALSATVICDSKAVAEAKGEKDIYVPSAGLNVTAVSDTPIVQAGDVATVSVLVAQAGDADAENVKLTCSLPEELTLDANVTHKGFPDQNGEEIEGDGVEIRRDDDRGWELTLAKLPPSAVGEVQFTVKVADNVSPKHLDARLSLTADGEAAVDALATLEVRRPTLALSDVAVRPNLAGRPTHDEEGRVLVAPGETFDYDVTVAVPAGEGALPARNVSLTITPVGEVSFAADTAPSTSWADGTDMVAPEDLTIENTGSALVVSVGEMVPGDSCVVHIPCVALETFNGASAASGMRVALSATNIDGASTETDVAPYALNLALTKEADIVRPALGQDVLFTISCRQTAAQASAKDVVIEDTLPAGLTSDPEREPQTSFGGATLEFDRAQNTLRVTVQSLSEGEPVVVLWPVRVTDAARLPITNTARATGRAGCAAEASATLSDHVHEWGEWRDVTDPTCTDEGLRQRSCVVSGCSVTDDEVLVALGHDWVSDWVITRKPSCTDAGLETESKICQRCHADESGATREIGVLGHDGTVHGQSWVQEPTCTVAGVRNSWFECSRCSTITSEVATESVPELGHEFENGHCVRCRAAEPLDHTHVYGAWNVVDAATCTESGLVRRFCASCHAAEEEVEPLLGHTAEGGRIEEVIDRDATCDEPGRKVENWLCGRCNAVYTSKAVDVPALGHDFTTGTCPRCGAERGEEHVHSWGDWVQGTEASCVNKGTRVRTCTICGEGEVDETQPTGHNPSITRQDWLVPATCLDGGTFADVAVCSVCGVEVARTERAGAPLGHVWGVDGKCERCGLVGDATHTDHVWGEWWVSVEPTCTREGTETRTCATCGEPESRSIAPLGHEFDPVTHRCIRCGIVEGTPEGPIDGAVDRRYLWAAIELASGLEASDYTSESWAVLAQALSRADYIFSDELATQEDVDWALAELNGAIEALVALPHETVPDAPAEEKPRPDDPWWWWPFGGTADADGSGDGGADAYDPDTQAPSTGSGSDQNAGSGSDLPSSGDQGGVPSDNLGEGPAQGSSDEPATGGNDAVVSGGGSGSVDWLGQTSGEGANDTVVIGGGSGAQDGVTYLGTQSVTPTTDGGVTVVDGGTGATYAGTPTTTVLTSGAASSPKVVTSKLADTGVLSLGSLGAAGAAALATMARRKIRTWAAKGQLGADNDDFNG